MREAHQDADDHQRPRHVAAHDALATSIAISPACGRGQRRAAEVIGLVQNRQREEQDQRRHHDAEQVADLHLGRRAAQDVAHLQVLQHFAGDGRRNADHRGDAQALRRRRRSPETPSATISSAAITSVHSVRPETGLFDDPIMPTRLPETAAKKNPSTIIISAADHRARDSTSSRQDSPALAMKK